MNCGDNKADTSDMSNRYKDGGHLEWHSQDTAQLTLSSFIRFRSSKTSAYSILPRVLYCSCI